MPTDPCTTLAMHNTYILNRFRNNHPEMSMYCCALNVLQLYWIKSYEYTNPPNAILSVFFLSSCKAKYPRYLNTWSYNRIRFKLAVTFKLVILALRTFTFVRPTLLISSFRGVSSILDLWDPFDKHGLNTQWTFIRINPENPQMIIKSRIKLLINSQTPALSSLTFGNG